MGDLVINTEGFQKLLDKLAELPKVVYKDMGYAILTATLMVEEAAKQNVHRIFHGKGQLAASITHKILKVKGLALTGVVGSSLPYATVHEFGATITPKNVSWLTIPFEGVTGRARDYENTFFAWRNNHLILFQSQGKNAKPKALFTLVKQAEVPARPWLNPALNENKKHLEEIISGALERSLKNVAGK